MTLASILVVDPDDSAREQISLGLREIGHDVTESKSAGAALALVRANRPDLLVCECLLPDLTGFELLKDLWSSEELHATRVVMTSASANSNHIESAFESGADDFVGKPINMQELLARVRACLRGSAKRHRSRTVEGGGISIDTVAHRVTVDGINIPVAPREYRLLLFLLKNQDRVFSRKQLLVHVWGENTSVGSRTVDVHIRRLRSVLEPYGYEGYFQTVRGSGYRFSLSA
jgi:two-component system phosphate regulon response regulator PhoB